MPKQTFLNLSKDKQNIILNAARKEFFRVPVSKALVSNIVKDSNIARGSFYQYFDDIQDLYNYFVKQELIKSKNEIFNSLEKHNYDVFKIFNEKYEICIKYMLTENQKDLLKHMHNEDYEKYILDGLKEELKDLDSKYFIRKFRDNNIDVNSFEEIGILMDLLKNVLKNALMSTACRDLEPNCSRKVFEIQMEKIQRGYLIERK